VDLISRGGKTVKILYLGDCDDEGFQIPLTLLQTLTKWAGGSPEFDVHDLYPRRGHEVVHQGSLMRFRRLALAPEQVESMKLSVLEINVKSKIARKFVDFKCELEAMEPDVLRDVIEESITEDWDEDSERRRLERTEELKEELRGRIQELTKGWEPSGER
jgi:hypothetical protein